MTLTGVLHDEALLILLGKGLEHLIPHDPADAALVDALADWRDGIDAVPHAALMSVDRAAEILAAV